jgi:hypothetical protein
MGTQFKVLHVFSGQGPSGTPHFRDGYLYGYAGLSIFRLRIPRL